MSSSFSTSILSHKDFWLGGAAVLGVLAIRSLIQLFQSPSLKAIERKCNKTLPVMGDSSQLTLWGFEAKGDYVEFPQGVSDASYYVSRVEAYLRAAKISYTKLASQGGSENPRGKVPFANVHGTMTDESGKILDLVKKHYGAKADLDKDLSPQQLATGHLLRSMLQGSLYWVTLHFFFHTEKGRKVFKSEIAHAIPPVIVDLVNAMVQRNLHNNLHGQGMGRMPEQDIILQAKADMKTLSFTLGKQDYLLGTKAPTSYDCDLYAMLALFFGHSFYSSLSWVAGVCEEHPNLDVYFQKMKDLLYPELKPKQKTS